MKMARRDFLNVSTAAAVVCATALLPVEKAAAAQQMMAAQELGTGVSVRISTGSDGCDPKGFNPHRNTEQYPCADQPVLPRGKAGSRPRSV